MAFQEARPTFVVEHSSFSLSSRSAASIASLLNDAIYFSSTHGDQMALLRMKQSHSNHARKLIWIHPLSTKCYYSFDEAVRELSLYLDYSCNSSSRSLLLRFSHETDSRSYLLIANHLDIHDIEDMGNQVCLEDLCVDKPLHSGGHRWQSIQQSISRIPGQCESSHNALLSIYNGRLVRGAFLALVLLAIVVFVSFSGLSTLPTPSSYVRYPTDGSIGPKFQLRIQWHNASDWIHSNAHNDDEWAFRMDDQSLVPAHLYDDDEDTYQQWFRQRYPHMTAVADRGDYVRPAWLGSREVGIEWDSMFHDAHCILAFRRYFKAKESGRHVCARDIYPGHIKHCLDKLDAKYFVPGEMTRHEPKQYMYWQTKVCFGEEDS
ncbi:hypothetical protein GGR57DRAFT_467793 [Xylariaceae sp. FL1272]|nr:hypothetical protein GGR57DRAFT_467793 [Xylariaceae sp. FL1272]